MFRRKNKKQAVKKGGRRRPQGALSSNSPKKSNKNLFTPSAQFVSEPPPPAYLDFDNEPPPPPLENHPDEIARREKEIRKQQMELQKQKEELQRQQQEFYKAQQHSGQLSDPQKRQARKSRYDFSHDEHVYESIENVEISRQKKRMSMNPNRYEGMSRPARISFQSDVGYDSGDNRGSFSSAVSAGSWSKNPKVKKKAGKKKPKPSKASLSGNYNGPRDPDHEPYIDYTVVPLLLRSGIDYDKANLFGDVLKLKYSTKNVKNIMTSYFPLFDALERENIAISQQVRLQVMDDAYWSTVGEDDHDGKSKRSSHIYFRELPNENNPRKKRASKRDSYMSAKTDFDQEFLDTEEDNSIELDDASFRKSMRMLFDNI